MAKKLKLILFGAPGSGKGTFAEQIKKISSNIVHVSTGDIFRENLKNSTPLGLKAKTYMDKGELVPDDLVIEIVKDRLNKEDVKQNGFILDGYPRTLSQAKALNDITDIDLVLLLEVSFSLIKKRILGRFSCNKCGEIFNKYTLEPKVKKGKDKWICDKCGAEIEFVQRSDDTEETLKNRVKIYEKNAKPVIKYYKKTKKVKKVDSSNTLELSLDDIKKIIEA
jgi:adenylate kinase